jgi:hypothetical protein
LQEEDKQFKIGFFFIRGKFYKWSMVNSQQSTTPEWFGFACLQLEGNRSKHRRAISTSVFIFEKKERQKKWLFN